MNRSAFALLLACILSLHCASRRAAVRTDAVDSSATASFLDLSRRFLDDYYAAHPVRATQLGVHAHDAHLPELGRQAIQRRLTALGQWSDELRSVGRAGLGADHRLDYRILEHAILAEQLELGEVEGWRRNPMMYNRVIANGMASLIDREFAPLEERLENLRSRMRAIPRIIRAAEENLTEVPALWAELALRNTRGTARFLRDDAPAALARQGLRDLDPEAIIAWEQSHTIAVQQLERFAEWLEGKLMPRAVGNFRLGPDLFRRKLLYEEHFDIGVHQLREMNEAAIENYQDWVAREVERVQTGADPAEVMRIIAADHPADDELIEQARRFVVQSRKFVIKRKLLTLPTDTLPVIRPTPAYARSGFASMSTPGPFESDGTESYYNITTVDPTWSEEQKEQHLTYFNYPGLLGISVHEVMPGHFVQLLYRRQARSELRKVFQPSSLIEGWAHYCEQMMIDEGLGDGDPKIRLGQLRRALQRQARWHAGLEMHAFGTTVDEAAKEFQKIAYFAEFPALRETQRGTYNPTYLYYALGRMEILRLREDYRRYREARGETFSLRTFHDQLLTLGLPIPLAREAMIPDESNSQL